MNIVDIFPNETIKYSKETQTANADNKTHEENDFTEDDINEKRKTPDKSPSNSINKKGNYFIIYFI